MKKISTLIIITLLLFFSYNTVLASEEPATLYSYYGNNMLFEQNEDAVLAGEAPSGTAITCTLYSSENKQLAYSEVTASEDNTFSISFKAPKGSFEEYKISLAANGTIFKELTGVVFGELWLAGGQSNMHWPLISSAEGYDMAYNNQRGSSAIRLLYVPHSGTYMNDPNKTPAYPLTDYETSAPWYKGDEVGIFNATAIGYFFAESMLKELNVPIGIIDASLGGTSILTWLPREAVENDNALLADCKTDNRYIPIEKWNESKGNAALDMTSNFNKMMNPLKNFRISGMIWYQGETDTSWEYGRYTRAFNALQRAYTKHFNYKNGLLPVVFTQLASYSYGDLSMLQNTNVEFSHIQQLSPESRALTSILDTPHDYTLDTHPIHPYYKKDISEKMAYAAKGLVYGLHDSYTAATVSSAEIKDSSIYVTFRDVGDGLMAEGDTLHAFTICGSDGVYVSAKAEIVSKDTVKVYSPSVVSPKGVAYAYSQSNIHANLFASRDGEKLLAVSPFITDMSLNYHHWHNDPWATCDFESFWHCHTYEYTGYYNTWNVKDAEISFKKSEIDTGNALYITSANSQFSVSPNLIYSEKGSPVYFQDVDIVWSDYDVLTFKVKNKTNNPLHFDGLKLKANDSLWIMPTVLGTKSTGFTIPADGNTHTITLNLNKLYPFGNINAAAYSISSVPYVWDCEFIFSNSSSENAEICFDDVSFMTGVTSAEESLPDTEPENKPSFIERIRAFFLSIYTRISLFFTKLFK